MPLDHASRLLVPAVPSFLVLCRFEKMMETSKPGTGDDRWPFVVHFIGCQLCGTNGEYDANKCITQMVRYEKQNKSCLLTSPPVSAGQGSVRWGSPDPQLEISRMGITKFPA